MMPRKFERAAVLLLLVASPFWLPVFPSRVGSSFRSTVIGWLQPGFNLVHSVREGIGGFGSGLLEMVSVWEENRLLRARLQALQAHEVTHQELAQENERLRRLLKFKSQARWTVVPAEVIGRDLGPWSRSLLINKGEKEGIRLGMAVITAVGLVGRISEVGNVSSRVALLTDPHFRVTGVLLEKRVSGLVMGGGSGDCVMTYLPLDLELKAGEPVLTSGGQSFAPSGIPVGVVEKFWRDSSEMYQTARLRPAAPLTGVDEVLVVSWRPSDSAR